MRIPNLHTAPNSHLIKIKVFLMKIDSYLKTCECVSVLKGWNPTVTVLYPDAGVLVEDGVRASHTLRFLSY